MKAIKNVVALAVAVASFTALNVHAYFDPSVGRFCSRDPIQEAGGVNLYGFVANNGINYNDAFGLWKIQSISGGGRALAIAENGDTVTKLATLRKFDDTDYKVWLKPVGNTAMPGSASEVINCGTFTIPNTIYFDMGRYSFLDNYFGAIGQWRDDAFTFSQQAQNAGFNVVISDPSSSGTASGHLASDDIYGFVFVGHGAGTGQIVFDPYNANNNDTMQPARRTQYGIAFLYAFGCDTAQQQSNDSIHPGLGAMLGYEYSAWEKNVAIRGNFVGVYGTVSGFQAWSNLIQTPGTNTK